MENGLDAMRTSSDDPTQLSFGAAGLATFGSQSMVFDDLGLEGMPPVLRQPTDQVIHWLTLCSHCLARPWCLWDGRWGAMLVQAL